MAEEIITLVVDPHTGTYRDPRDEADDHARSDVRKTADRWNDKVMKFQLKFIFAVSVLVTSFWLFHYLDMRWMNAVAFLTLTVGIWVVGTSPKWLVAIFALGALVRPGSETDRLLAGTEAVKTWVTKWVPVALHALQLSALFFLVWPFEVHFGQFVMGTITLIFVGVSMVRFNIALGSWLKNISFWGGIALFLFIMTSSVMGWSIFSERQAPNLPAFVQGQTTLTQAAPPPPQAPAGAMTSVFVPACNPAGTSWSEVVNIPAYWAVNPAWTVNRDVRLQIRSGATWRLQNERYESGAINAVRYCAILPGLAGETMPLTWNR